MSNKKITTDHRDSQQNDWSSQHLRQSVEEAQRCEHPFMALLTQEHRTYCYACNTVIWRDGAPVAEVEDAEGAKAEQVEKNVRLASTLIDVQRELFAAKRALYEVIEAAGAADLMLAIAKRALTAESVTGEAK